MISAKYARELVKQHEDKVNEYNIRGKFEKAEKAASEDIENSARLGNSFTWLDFGSRYTFEKIYKDKDVRLHLKKVLEQQGFKVCISPFWCWIRGGIAVSW